MPEDRRGVRSEAEALAVRVVSRSDVGLLRRQNEDALILVDLVTGDAPENGAVGPDGVLLLGVCDGMGGEAAGEVASRLASETVRACMVRSFGGDVAVDAAALVESVEQAGRAIRRHAKDHPACAGMGTTCSVGAISGGVMTVAHVGDSRGYLLRDGELAQLTRDHNLASELLARGRISADQVSNVPHGKRITQAVGGSGALEVDTARLSLRPGDRLLFCSDGLSDMLSDEAIADVLSASLDPAVAADELVRSANAAGGRDNISLVIADVEAAEGDPATQYRVPTYGSFVAWPVGAAFVLAVAGWWLLANDSTAGKGPVPPTATQVAASELAPRLERAPEVRSESVSEEAPAAALPSEEAPVVVVPSEESEPLPKPKATVARSRPKQSHPVDESVRGSLLGSSSVSEADVVLPPVPGKRNPF